MYPAVTHPRQCLARVFSRLGVTLCLGICVASSAGTSEAFAQSGNTDTVPGNRIDVARELLSTGRFTSAAAVLESLVSDSTDHVEGRVLLLRLRQDSYLRSKGQALELSRQLQRLAKDDLIVNGDSLELELRLRHLQLTLSPMKSASAMDRRRAQAASDLLKRDLSHPLALLERATEALMLNDLQKVNDYAQSALDSDPLSHQAYLMKFRILAESKRFPEIDVLSAQMQEMLPENPYGWTMAGYSAFRQRNLERAETQFQAALEKMTYDLRRAYIDATSYFRDDVAGQSGQDSVAFSLNYWVDNDPLHLTPVNERMLEHFARLTYSDLYYSDVYTDRIGWETDRGQFIARYGEPDLIARVTRKEPGFSIFDLSEAQRREGMFRPMPKTLEDDLLKESKTSDRFERWVYGDESFQFYDTWWTGSYVLYSRSAFAFSRIPNLRDDVIEARNYFFKEPMRTNFRLPGARIPLTFVSTRMRVEGKTPDQSSDAEMDVIVAQGVPVPYRPRQGALNSPVRIGSFLTGLRHGMAGRYTEEFEYLESYSIVSLDNTMFWSHSNTLRVPSDDTYTLSVEYQSLPSAAVYGVQRTDVAPLEGADEDGGPAVSDLLLCYYVEEGLQNPEFTEQGFRRYGHEMFPAPDVLFSPGEPLYVYFEVYDLTSGNAGRSTFSIETVLVPAEKERGGVSGLFSRLLSRKRTAAVSVTFDAEGNTAVVPYYILLDTGDVEPGEYDLAIRIKDGLTGKTASSMRTILLQ